MAQKHVKLPCAASFWSLLRDFPTQNSSSKVILAHENMPPAVGVVGDLVPSTSFFEAHYFTLHDIRNPKLGICHHLFPLPLEKRLLMSGISELNLLTFLSSFDRSGKLVDKNSRGSAKQGHYHLFEMSTRPQCDISTLLWPILCFSVLSNLGQFWFIFDHFSSI